MKWRLTASWPKSLDTLYGSCETISKYVAEATDNKFQIQSFAAGEIVPGLQVLDAVQNGTVEMGHTATYYYHRQGTYLGAVLRRALRAERASAECWFYDGAGTKLMNDFGQEVERVLPSWRQYRRANGRLVPQRDQDSR